MMSNPDMGIEENDCYRIKQEQRDDREVYQVLNKSRGLAWYTDTLEEAKTQVSHITESQEVPAGWTITLEIWAGRDQDGNMRSDCHNGIQTIYPFGCSTCITDYADFDEFPAELRERIESLLKKQTENKGKVKP